MKRVVLVTGDSSGIGRAACTQLSASDWIVYGASRSDVTNASWSHVAMDVTDEASVAAAVAGIVAQEGRLDAVVDAVTRPTKRQSVIYLGRAI